jgi:hypothetical protein
MSKFSPDAIALVKYVADASGKKTDVLVPVKVWEALLASWQEMAEILEDREDIATFQEWLNQRHKGEAETISLEAFEQELITDGLV